MKTGIIGSPKPGITRRIMQGDENNGFIWESTPQGIKLTLRSKASGIVSNSNSVFLSDANIDKLDGTGPSGVVADWDKVQIFGEFYEWLGVGSAWMVVVVNGVIWPVHRFDCANIGEVVYMSTPNLPIRYEIINDGTGAEASITHICSTVICEGGFADTGVLRGIPRTTSLVTGNDTNFYSLIAIRMASSQLGATIRPSTGSIICTSTAAYAWQLVLNPTVLGTPLAFSSVLNSAVEADVSRTSASTISGGTIVAAGVAQSVSESGVVLGLPSDIQIGSTIAGVSDVLVLAVSRLTGNAETFYGALNWREQVLRLGVLLTGASVVHGNQVPAHVRLPVFQLALESG
jgi:hypothetical protein